MRVIFGFLAYTFNGASILVGTVIGAVSIAAFLGRQFGLEFAEFPSSLVGLYQNMRAIIFVWVPNWWPTWLSDIALLYLAIGFAIYRARRFVSILAGNSGYLNFTGPEFLWLLFWPIDFRYWFAMRRYKAAVEALEIGEEDSQETDQSVLYALSFKENMKADLRYIWAMPASIILTISGAVLLIYFQHIQNLAGF